MSVTKGATRRTHELIVRSVGEETLILDRGADQVHQLNASASLIWRLAENGARPAEIADALIDRFDVPSDRALQDTEATLRSLHGLGLLNGTGAAR